MGAHRRELDQEPLATSELADRRTDISHVPQSMDPADTSLIPPLVVLFSGMFVEAEGLQNRRRQGRSKRADSCDIVG